MPRIGALLTSGAAARYFLKTNSLGPLRNLLAPQDENGSTDAPPEEEADE